MVLLYYSPPHTLSTAFSIKKVLDESVKIILLNLYLRVLIFSIICVMEWVLYKRHSCRLKDAEELKETQLCNCLSYKVNQLLFSWSIVCYKLIIQTCILCRYFLVNEQSMSVTLRKITNCVVSARIESFKQNRISKRISHHELNNFSALCSFLMRLLVILTNVI